jgi:hypothetical protein
MKVPLIYRKHLLTRMIVREISMNPKTTAVSRHLFKTKLIIFNSILTMF